MKKLCSIALAAILMLSLAACGRNKTEDTVPTTTLPTTVPTTERSILPEMDPTMDTNVPDADVEGAVPDGNDGMDMMPDGGENKNDHTNGNNTTGNSDK